MTIDTLNQAIVIKDQIDRLNNIKYSVIANGTNDSEVKYTFPNIVLNESDLIELGVVINIPEIEDLKQQVTDLCDTKIAVLQTQLSAL